MWIILALWPTEVRRWGSGVRNSQLSGFFFFAKIRLTWGNIWNRASAFFVRRAEAKLYMDFPLLQNWKFNASSNVYRYIKLVLFLFYTDILLFCSNQTYFFQFLAAIKSSFNSFLRPHTTPPFYFNFYFKVRIYIYRYIYHCFAIPFHTFQKTPIAPRNNKR